MRLFFASQNARTFGRSRRLRVFIVVWIMIWVLPSVQFSFQGKQERVPDAWVSGVFPRGSRWSCRCSLVLFFQECVYRVFRHIFLHSKTDRKPVLSVLWFPTEVCFLCGSCVYFGGSCKMLLEIKKEGNFTPQSLIWSGDSAVFRYSLQALPSQPWEHPWWRSCLVLELEAQALSRTLRECEIHSR